MNAVGDLIFLLTLLISILYYFSVRNRVLKNVTKRVTVEKCSGTEVPGSFAIGLDDRLKVRGEVANKLSSLRISIVIPARNEEKNLPKILSCLASQTWKIEEIVVVNDNSTDGTERVTREFSRKCSNVRVVSLSSDPPNGWVGKSWALWNGVLSTTGDVLIFLDADVEPTPTAVETLVSLYAEFGGLISVWPYQRFERFYEHLGMFGNLMAVYASNYFEFAGIPPSGAFGPVIVTSREDYLRTGGHEAIKDSVLEDVKLGKLYVEHGLSVKNFIGGELIKFRMYPHGVGQLFEGFSKNMGAGAVTGGLLAFLFAFIWMAGMSGSLAYFLFPHMMWRYFVHVAQVYLLAKPTGDYRLYDALLYPIHLLFFLAVFAVSIYRTAFIGKVSWKGRKIDVR